MTDFFSRPDLWVIAVYMLGMLGVAWYVSAGSRDAEGYTLGNRQLPGWAIGLSVLGTFTSSLTFLGGPGKIFREGDWNYLSFTVALPFSALIAVIWFVPLYRRSVRLSAYELLEQRFGYWARLYADASYILLQLLRVAMVLLLVALAVDDLLGWDVISTLVGLGVLVIIYDVLGGIRAVIWTDVVQVVVLCVGALWCLVVLVTDWPGGAGGFWSDIPAGSLSLGELASWDLAKSTFLVVFVYGLSENLRNYGTDQNYVQRVLAAPSDREAAKSIWIGALSYIPISLMIGLIGIGLAMNYRIADSETAYATTSAATATGNTVVLPAGTTPDEVFPHFIQTELPLGVSGLVIAAILAAAMSTVDSSLNSTSTVVLEDILRRFRRGEPRVPEIITLRISTVVLGVLGTGMAVAVYWRLGEASGTIMDQWWKYAGAAGGGMFGLFLLAWLLPRLPAWGALLATITTFPVLLWGLLATDLPADSPWKPLECRLHGNLVGVSGTLVVLLVGGTIWAAVLGGFVRAGSRYPRD